ncbi:MAG: hypothetical protein KGQ41_06510 [Alphaproteobacteria bacterium]|nr:hypothetical protein [Alphaproteobacteria bacterium]
MGEGVNPLSAASNEQPANLPTPRETNFGETRWPPRGWPMFACVTNTSGSAHTNERGQASNTFLRYDISIDDDGLYCIEITNCQTGRNGTSCTPAIGIRFKAREDWYEDNPQKSVASIHVGGQTLIPEKGAILRVILAMTYIISRIDRGQAPNLRRVLGIYRLV